MSDENHPLLKKALESINASDEDDRPAIYSAMVSAAALYAPEGREMAIAAIAKALDDDAANRDDQGNPKPVGSLRQRSQLVSLHRHMTDAHWKLKNSGR